MKESAGVSGGWRVESWHHGVTLTVEGVRTHSGTMEGTGPSKLVKGGHPTDRLSVSLDQLSVSLDQLSVSLYKLSVSLHQLSVSLHQLSVSLDQLSVSLYKLSVSLHQLSVSLDQLSVSLDTAVCMTVVLTPDLARQGLVNVANLWVEEANPAVMESIHARKV